MRLVRSARARAKRPRSAPICNTIAMNHHLREISSQVGAAAHALLVLTPAPAEAGGAGWHDSQALAIPDNITLLALPPYSPEADPVERIWHYLRSHWLANSVFFSLADIMDACEKGVELLRCRPRLDPFAVRRRLGARLAPDLHECYTPRSEDNIRASGAGVRLGRLAWAALCFFPPRFSQTRRPNKMKRAGGGACLTGSILDGPRGDARPPIRARANARARPRLKPLVGGPGPAAGVAVVPFRA